MSVMNADEPVLDDQDVRDYMRALEADGFPVDETVRVALVLVGHARGPEAEEAVRSLVARLPEGQLNNLVREHVIRHPNPDPKHDFDYCGSGRSILAIDLVARGFDPVVSGWRVGWPGGKVLEGENLCRLALLAVWLRTMSDSEE